NGDRTRSPVSGKDRIRMTSRKTWLGGLTLALAMLAVVPADAAPLPGHVKGRFEPEKWLAADAEMVMAINVRQMLDSPLMKKGGSLDELKKMVNANEQLKTMLKAVELDPFRDIHAVLASGSLSMGKDVRALVVVRGKYNLPKI